MPSQLRSDTARANGAKSKGPTTAAGKEASSRNALRHGLTSYHTVTLQYESAEKFQEMRAEFHAIYKPLNAAEEDLVDQMLAARWRIRRLWVIETGLLDAEIALRRPEVEKKYTHCSAAIEIALAFRSLADESRSLALASRYEARLSRIYDRAYHTLRELQQHRTAPTAADPVVRDLPSPAPPEPAIKNDETNPDHVQPTPPPAHDFSDVAIAAPLDPGMPRTNLAAEIPPPERECRNAGLQSRAREQAEGIDALPQA